MRVSQTKAQRLDEFFGVIFKAMRADPSVPRVVAFVKRLLQMSFANEAGFTCACLLVINEVLRSRQDVKYAIFSQTAKPTAAQASTVVAQSDSDEEVFVDADKELEASKTAAKAQQQALIEESKSQPYDAIKREPKYANAEREPLWELVTLARHCHPTVAMWAQELLKGELLEYEGDPLLDFGLTNFLDRISYKMPKNEDKIKQHRQRMAQFEKPLNQIDFARGEKPQQQRLEEEYMTKYFEMKPPKIQ